MKVIVTFQMNCTVTSFQKTGGARHPLGPMDATPMTVIFAVILVENWSTGNLCTLARCVC